MRIAILIALAVAFVTFVLALPKRNEIDSCLQKVETPEARAWRGYCAKDLDAFKDRASEVGLSGGGTALANYLTPVLLPLDVIFAISLGAFIALLGIEWAGHFSGWARYALYLSAAFGIAYAVLDVAEDIALYRLLALSHTISKGEAETASLLTRGKAAALVLSGTGGVAFGALSVIRKMTTITSGEPTCGTKP